MRGPKSFLKSFRRREFRLSYSTIALVLFLLSMPLSFGDKDTGQLEVINRTEHFLHLIIDGDPYLYVAPTQSIVHEAKHDYSFFVTAFYSPGQGVTARIERELTVPYTPSEWGCTSEGCQCTPTEPEYGSGLWRINADTMTVTP